MINTTIAHLDYCLKFLHEEADWLRKHNAGLFWAEVKIRKLDAIAASAETRANAGREA